MEASLTSQLWRGVRFCLSLLVGLTVLSVVFEEKGLGRGMMNNPDHRPEQVTNVRFGDVKGVDEAKASPGPDWARWGMVGMQLVVDSLVGSWQRDAWDVVACSLLHKAIAYCMCQPVHSQSACTGIQVCKPVP